MSGECIRQKVMKTGRGVRDLMMDGSLSFLICKFDDKDFTRAYFTPPDVRYVLHLCRTASTKNKNAKATRL